MKANEAPKKIYISLIPSISGGHVYTTVNKDFPNAIEYTRTDAFIEKACDAYCKVCGHYAHKTPTYICRQACDYYKDFKQAMKDE